MSEAPLITPLVPLGDFITKLGRPAVKTALHTYLMRLREQGWDVSQTVKKALRCGATLDKEVLLCNLCCPLSRPIHPTPFIAAPTPSHCCLPPIPRFTFMVALLLTMSPPPTSQCGPPPSFHLPLPPCHCALKPLSHCNMLGSNQTSSTPCPHQTCMPKGLVLTALPHGLSA